MTTTPVSPKTCTTAVALLQPLSFSQGHPHQSPCQAHSSPPAAPTNPVNQLLAVPQQTRPRVTCPPANQAHACSQILTFRPLPIKPHVIFIGKGRFCLYLCTPCTPYTACKYKYPRHPLGAPGILVKDQSVHLMILVTRPEPTVRPPSRIAKPRPSSMAMGWIS